ncbi:putative polysaccharide biosynthesis protein [Companilactobacillus baiquanensis]|uniref:Oligosaccharide flippase family protein n=1 Tax=Companilactobacillus baiquanensis TaxID=2486005 RepID=A0ABW1UVK2_9LACO|nr:oligosaccharide flippase family protein [Companilactobacillus baiquanensis]
MRKETSRAIQGTWILTIASLFSELLSAIYRIPLQNIVGDRGYFIYQQVYPIYGIFSVLALSGLPVIISKVFAQQNEIESKSKLMKNIFAILLIISVAITGLLWLSAHHLANFMGDPNLYHEVRAVSLTFLLIPFEASLRGYFQSELLMEPSAISQISEQLVRIIVIIGAAMMFGKGLLNEYQMGTIANGGAFIGGLFAVIVLAVSLFVKRPFVKDDQNANLTFEKGLPLEIVLIIIFTGVTIFYQFIDSFSMLRLLMKFGRPLAEAEVLKGIFDRAQPLIQLGIVISLSFVSAIMPQLKSEKFDMNKQLIGKMMRVCLWLATAETAGLVALMPVINTMLFTNSDGSFALGIYMMSIVIVSGINLLIAVTSSDNEKNTSKLVIFLLSLVAKIILNILFVPRFSIVGAALATVLSELIILIGLLVIYSSDRGTLLIGRNFTLKVLASGLFMALCIRALEKFMTQYLSLTRMSSVLINLILIPIGVLIYLFMSKTLSILDKSEWKILPMGKLFVKIMRIK